jgi:hypothetical protein
MNNHFIKLRKWNQTMHSSFLRKVFGRNTIRLIPVISRFSFFVFFSLVLFGATNVNAQDWIKTGTGLGVEKIRLAVPDFKALS